MPDQHPDTSPAPSTGFTSSDSDVNKRDLGEGVAGVNGLKDGSSENHDTHLHNGKKMDHAKHDSRKAPRQTKAKTVRNLFRYATKCDYLFLVLGTFASIAHGFVLPAALFVLAGVTDSFVMHEASRIVANTDTQIPVGFIGDVIGGSDGIEQGRFCNFQGELSCNDPGVTCTNASFGADISFNCSKKLTFELPYPYLIKVELSITEILDNCLFATAQCLDNESFIVVINELIYSLLAVSLAATLLGSLQVLLFQTVCERQMQNMRLHYYRALLRQELGWFDQSPAGELCYKLSDDFEKIHDGIGSNLAILIQWIATFAAALAVGLYRNWMMTLTLLAAMPLVVVPSAIFNRIGVTFTSVEQKHYASAGAIAEEVLSAIRTVVAFGGEHKESMRYKEHLSEVRKVGRQRGVTGGLSLFAAYFALFSTFALAFWFAGYLVSERIAAPGDVIAVFFAFTIGGFYLGQSTINIGRVMEAAVTAIPVFETIDRKPLIDSSSDSGEKLDKFDGSVEFRNVTFFYPARPDVKVIQEFNLSISKGQTVAVVGHSGSGKTTLANLIQRFYDITEGEILIGGKDIRSLNIKWLRDQIGIVAQEPMLFNTTIAENIRFGRLDATMEDIIKAAKMANVHDFIFSLPQQYNTVVGEQGTQLSGGQKQRISIARALVRDPQILLLDEATSALDSENEVAVQAALKRAQKGRTTIVIAHRLSMIQNADCVVSMDNGRIVWLGKPSDFFAEKGIQLPNEKEYADIIPSNYTASGSFRRQTHSLRKRTGSLRRMLMETSDKKVSDFSVFLRVIKTNQKEWWIAMLGVIGAIMLGAAFPTFALIFGEILEAFVQPPSLVLPGIHLWAGLFFLLGFLAGLGGFVKTFCFSVSGENLTLRLRYQAFKAMMRQEMGWFDEEEHSTGALTSALADDTRNVQGAAGARVGTIVEGATALILAHLIGFRFSWILTFVLMGVVPLYILSGWLHVKVSAGFAGLQQQALRDAARIAVESVENISTVASLGLEDRFYSDYEKKVKKPLRCTLLTAPLYGISQGVLLLGYIVAFRFGAFQVTLSEDHILYASFADIFRIFAALIFASVNIGLSTSLAPDYAKAKKSARRIFSLLDRKPKLDGYSEEGMVLETFQDDIAIQDVYFKYPVRPEVQVLQNFTLSVKMGQTLALVGSSGCGKSTILTLIERLYDPLMGSLSLDGTDLKDLNIRWLRSQIGIVSQEPILFDATIAENIRYGANFREVSDAEVEEAARTANIHDFIKSLPKGYNTNVGIRGTQLSGGQKQRISIARALVRNPKILLLDEATSALDSENEVIVQAALDRARQGRTCIIVSHRLSTICSADCIAVVKGGSITELGTHDTLTAKQGIYYRLTCFQSRSTSHI